MYRANSPFASELSSYAASIQSNGYSTMDETSSQASCMSRPSGKSIYRQRKEYGASMNQMMNSFQYRVEHLFTCYLDGRELRGVADCLERLKLLDRMGRVWGQGMLLEVCGSNLLLTDIETKEELESIALRDILELKAVLGTAEFDSLLTVSVRQGSVFMFQCEDVRADYVQTDLSQALSRWREDPSISNAGLIAGHAGRNNLRNVAKTPERKEQYPAFDSAPDWNPPEFHEEEDVLEPELLLPRGEEESITEEPLFPPHSYTELDRDVDILNQLLNDIEIFVGKIAAALAKDAKKSKKKKKTKKGKVVRGLPPAGEFAECLHKIKCAFNLLGELNGQINNPTAPEFIRSLFGNLAFVVSHCPEDLPPTIEAPLLTPQCVRLMSDEASAEDDLMWQSLGDAWNTPSDKWFGDAEDTNPVVFYDGRQPLDVSDGPETSVTPVSRQEIHEPAPSQRYAEQMPQSPQLKPRFLSPAESKPGLMRAKYDFKSRNQRELTIRKGELIEVLDNSKLWWKVRNNRGVEGFVPNNVLEEDDELPDENTGGAPVLTRRSKPVQVKAWLAHMGFSKITVRCLGVLSGPMLLGMTREELKIVCPEEGGRVFYQLQAVKSAMAAAS